ncbi:MULTISPECIES: DNA-directed DNA polymerase [Thiomicrorhabdus]|uniref:DNA-directed DNA polymerase n=1 Tax=Thiomicrorhabdus heinhorstiae TaxID=2748010 RepID=A0ABS0BXK5_9GAMM|nr:MULTISPECIES: DNA-directed DNA polymerase [Thiomicrorhabdus]MBF6058533.1 DNA-directed DNA polymerase [Thiomicrorhabdus heinhorstiae]
MNQDEIYPWLQPAWQDWKKLNSRLGHAYLISALPGVGMESWIRTLAKAALCPNTAAHDQTACGQCSSCHLFDTDQHPDFYHLHRLPDKKEIGVDQIREFIYQQQETAHQGGYKVAWIEGVEHLNLSAFNALLKTLEEPGERSLFLLSCHQVANLPATIKSRCQQIHLPTPPLEVANQWLSMQCPQMDQALLKRALRINWGAPLKALRWIKEGKFDEDREWNEALKQLQSGKKNVVQVCAQWLKWPHPEAVFDYFYQWSVGFIRHQVYPQAGNLQTDEVSAALKFQQQVLTAKSFWQRNANKELVLENLCLQWLALQQGKQDESIFRSQLNRGQLV